MSFSERLGDFPVLETERLVLRQPRPEEDAPLHHRIWSDPRVVEHTPNLLNENLEESVRKLTRLRGWYYDETHILGWIITRRDEDRMMGGIRYIGFSGWQFQIGEIGYELNPEEWNHGYMTEALRAVADFGFQKINLNRVQLTIDPRNGASLRVAAKAGFCEEGVLRDWNFCCRTNRWVDQAMYSRVRGR